MDRQEPLESAEPAAPPARSDIAFVLVDPEQPWNVGAVARAMANLGWSDLRIAGECRNDWRAHDEARRMAHGALEVLDGMRAYPTLAAALADRTYVIGTSARRRVTRQLRLLDATLAQTVAEERAIAFVFGNERTGLANEDLAHCHEVVTIPTHGAQTSLNLAQAALLIGYVASGIAGLAPRPPRRARPVTQQLGQTLARLEAALATLGFFREFMHEESRRHLQRIALRGVESSQELGILERLAHRIRLFASGQVTSADISPRHEKATPGCTSLGPEVRRASEDSAGENASAPR